MLPENVSIVTNIRSFHYIFRRTGLKFEQTEVSWLKNSKKKVNLNLIKVYTQL